jgi:sirohydrochlorin cobaltochelatase
VAIAFLELQPPTLATALADAVALNRKRIDIVPVFWASGGHVVNDLPRMIEDFGRTHPDVELRVLPVLSELPGLLDFVADAVVRGPS